MHLENIALGRCMGCGEDAVAINADKMCGPCGDSVDQWVDGARVQAGKWFDLAVSQALTKLTSAELHARLEGPR